MIPLLRCLAHQGGEGACPSASALRSLEVRELCEQELIARGCIQSTNGKCVYSSPLAVLKFWTEGFKVRGKKDDQLLYLL